jgi:hypothetical protein
MVPVRDATSVTPGTPARARARVRLVLVLAGAAAGAAAAMALAGGTAGAQSPPDPASGASDPAAGDDSDDGGAEGGATGPIAVPFVLPTVALEGPANAAIPAFGEAWTTWRYGRHGERVVDEATSHLRVSGSGRTTDGLAVSFSVALLEPSLRPGTYGDRGSLASSASLWGNRGDRSDVPSIEWDGAMRDAGPGAVTITVTSVTEASHDAERSGTLTVDTTRLHVHGSIVATLPCKHSVVALRAICRPATLRGNF